jgi:hypothetical protein
MWLAIRQCCVAGPDICSGAGHGQRSARYFIAVVMPRESGASSTPQLRGSIMSALEYWIARWSLSSGDALR